MTSEAAVVSVMALFATVWIVRHICDTVVAVAQAKYQSKPPAEQSHDPSPCQPPAGGLD